MQEAIELKFKFTISRVDRDVVVQFNPISKYYIREVSLLEKNQLPSSLTKQYECQVHFNHIKFHPVQEIPDDNAQLIQVLKKYFNHIKIYQLKKTQLQNNNKYKNLCHTITLSQGFRCWKLVLDVDINQTKQYNANDKLEVNPQPNKDFTISESFIIKQNQKLQIGDLLLFYNKSNEAEAERILSKVKGFYEEELSYILNQYFLRSGLPYQSQALQLQTTKVLINTFQDELKSLTEKNRLILIDITPCKGKWAFSANNKRYNMALNFKIQGNSKKFIQFFIDLQQFFKKNTLRIIKVDQIRCCKLQDLKQHSDFRLTKMFALDRTTIAVFQLQQEVKELIIKLRTGSWLINSEFKESQLQELIQTQNGLKLFLHNNNIIVQNLNFSPGGIIFKSVKEVKDAFVNACFEFLDKIKKITSPCTTFNDGDPFLIHIFLKLYAEKLEKECMAKFVFQKGRLFRVNIAEMEAQTFQALQQCYKQILTKIVRYPTLRKPANNNPLFKIIENPPQCDIDTLPCLRLQLTPNIYVNLAPYCSTGLTQEDLMIFMTNEQTALNSPFADIMGEIGSNFVRHLESSGKKKGHRATLFSSVASKKCRHMLCWFIDTNPYFRRKVQQSIQAIIETLSSLKLSKFSIVLPDNNMDLVVRDLPLLIDEVLNKFKDKKDKWEITVLYNNEEQKQEARRKMKQQFEAKRKNLLYLDRPRIEKILNLNYHTLAYFEDNVRKDTTAMNSFVFKHQLTKVKPMAKMVPIAIPKSGMRCQKQYLFDYMNDQYYTIGRHAEVKPHRTKLVSINNNEVSKIIQIIKRFFGNLEYFVLPVPQMPQDGKLLDHLNFFMARDDGLDSLVSININIKKQIITERDGIKIPFGLLNNEHKDCYLIETHQDCLPELRKQIYNSQTK